MVKTIGIVSLSNGTIGEDFVKHELAIGEKRLYELGLNIKYMNNAKAGIDYLMAHPKKRAEDLLQAFLDPEVDMILSGIGGDDTYRLTPYLFDDNKLKKAIHKKIFLGFSDTTINHFMLHKLGLKTFYGQSFLSDICELGGDILPYTKSYFSELIQTGRISEITPSPIWYKERDNFGVEEIGNDLKEYYNNGFELLQGRSVFFGEILGGCLDTIFDIFDGSRHSDSPLISSAYKLFPEKNEWVGKILLLETSEEKMPPEKFATGIETLKNTGIFNVINGILVGKPMDNTYYNEYKDTLIHVINNPNLPIVYNINIGHAKPRCIIPFGVKAIVNTDLQKIKFIYR